MTLMTFTCNRSLVVVVQVLTTFVDVRSNESTRSPIALMCLLMEIVIFILHNKRRVAIVDTVRYLCLAERFLKSTANLNIATHARRCIVPFVYLIASLLCIIITSTNSTIRSQALFQHIVMRRVVIRMRRVTLSIRRRVHLLK